MADVGMRWLLEHRPDIRPDLSVNEGGGERFDLERRPGAPRRRGRGEGHLPGPGQRARRGRARHRTPTVGDNAVPHLGEVLAGSAAGCRRRDDTRSSTPCSTCCSATGTTRTATSPGAGRRRPRCTRSSSTTCPRWPGPRWRRPWSGASDKRNVMPSRAWVELDCRLLPGTTKAEVEATVRERLGADLRLRADLARAAHRGQLLPRGRPGARRDRVVPRRRGRRRRGLLPSLGTGFTDSVYLRAAAGTAAYGFSPVPRRPRSTCWSPATTTPTSGCTSTTCTLRAVPPAPRAAVARMRAADLGIRIGTLEPGPHDAITDVPGVRVGHATVVAGDDVRTGVTVVVPARRQRLERPASTRRTTGSTATAR